MKPARQDVRDSEGPRVVVRQTARGKGRRAPPWDEARRYSIIGWIGFILALAALSDYVLALYPLGLGSPEWELATIGSIVQGLPLFSIGLGAIWISAGGLGRRWLLIVLGWALLLLAIVAFGALAVFATDVPLALKATHGVARIGIEKLTAKTFFLGLLFGGSYVLVGVLALRQTRAV